MIGISRTDTSMVGRWWWTVDRWLLLILLMLAGFGVLLNLASSPSVAQRLDLQPFHFIERHLLFLVPALSVMISISLMSALTVRRIACVAFVTFLGIAVLTLFIGPEINGSQRWVLIGKYSLQPTEFLKPSFVVVAAWMFAAQSGPDPIPGNLISSMLLTSVLAILLLQPDVGQAALVSSVWLVQFFIAGMPLIWLTGFIAAGLLVATATYISFPHVARRIDAFINPAGNDTLQTDNAISAFQNGGLFGVGRGEGIIKQSLPDAHSDFIFAVAAEELGLLACLALLGLFALFVIRGFTKILQERDLFLLLAVAGLLIQFGFQALINIGVNLAILPNTGMTLPFISYGGSSLLAVALTAGMILALTRQSAAIEQPSERYLWRPVGPESLIPDGGMR